MSVDGWDDQEKGDWVTKLILVILIVGFIIGIGSTLSFYAEMLSNAPL